MPETMTKQAEARIMEALERVARDVQDGDAPDPAIAKAASALNLPSGHVALICNAYNIGRSARQREDGDSPFEKGADFALADAAAVLKSLFPDRVKAAAEVYVEDGISPEYRLPAATWYGRARRDRAMKAAAAAIDWSLGVPPPPPLPRDPAHALKVAAANQDRARRALAEARTKRAAAEGAILAGLDQVATLLARTDRPALVDVRPAAEALHGTKAAAVLDQIARTRPALAKAAARRPFHDARREPVYAAIGRTAAAADALLAGEQAVKEAEAAALALRPTLAEPVSAVLADIDEEGPLKQAFFPNGLGLADKALGTTVYHGLTQMGRQLQPPALDESVDKTMAELGSPDHEQRLRAIHAQALLHEMMLDDPYISGQDPSEVARTYNRISQFAPSSASQPLVALPLMRKALQEGQVDAFGADQLAGIENKLRQQPIAGLDIATKARDLMKRQPPFDYKKDPGPLEGLAKGFAPNAARHVAARKPAEPPKEKGKE
jgi:hypothetical protein